MEQDKMLEQLQESMKACEQEYNNCIAQLEQLAQRKEQIRGQYTAYYDLYQKLAGGQTVEQKVEEVKNEEPKQENKKEEIKVEENKEEVKKQKKENKKEEAQIEEIVNQVNNKSKVKEEDIPEYLREEYNK